MALSGTLKDFGIADILQLIGHQTKTGQLVLKSGGDEVDVLFVDGHVVFATQKARNRADLLGSLLLRAELITDEKLQEALEEQQDRKSTRLNSSHRCISYAVFCLKKKKKQCI